MDTVLSLIKIDYSYLKAITYRIKIVFKVKILKNTNKPYKG